MSPRPRAPIRGCRTGVVQVVSRCAVFVLASCGGDCPERFYDPAEPERTEVHTFQLEDGGEITHAKGDPPGALEVVPALQKDESRAVFQNADISCESACDQLAMWYTDGSVQSCTFIDADRTSLRCVVYFDAVEESCRCSIIDCG